MERITKHTLFISALLLSAVGALSIGLYLRAVNADTKETTTMAMPSDMATMHEKMMEEMPEMHEKMMAPEPTEEEPVAAEPELSEEELAAIIDTISTPTGEQMVGTQEEEKEVVAPAALTPEEETTLEEATAALEPQEETEQTQEEIEQAPETDITPAG